MTNRQLLFAVTLVVACIVTSCSDSRKTTQATPATSPAPRLDAQKLVTPTTRSAKAPEAPGKGYQPAPDLLTGVPVKTFHVKPPASFAADQLPEGLLEFMVPGSADQLLLVHAGINNAKVVVELPGAGSKRLSAGGDCGRNSLYVLPQTATYRVLYHPGQWKAGIDITLFANNDPIIGPGIRPEQVSIDFGAFAQGPLATFPYSVACGEGDESWPSHLGVQNDRFEFRIMPVEAYQRMLIFEPRMSNLETALRPGGKVPAGKDLPYAYLGRGSAYVMSARQQPLEGEGWRGLRWIAGYGGSGDADYPSDGLGYVFSGITNDGRYLIVLSADISHPDQKRLYPQRQINGPPGHTWESPDPKVDTPARIQLERSLAAADPASFVPNLDQLDAVIRSLKLKR